MRIGGSLNRALLAGLVFASSFGFLARGIRVGGEGDVPPFFIDEAHKLGEAYYWHLFAEDRSFRDPDWSEDFYARTNPPFSKYVFGAALALGGVPVRDHRLQQAFERDWMRPEVLRAQVPDAPLRITRRTSALFSAGACGLLTWIAGDIAGPIAGLAAALLFLAHPVVQEQSRLGLADPLLLFSLILIVPVTVRAAAALEGWRGPRAALLGAALPGLVVGLAAATKLTGALAGVAYAGGMLAAALRADAGASRGRRLAAALALCAGAGALALAVFVAINPYLYESPWTRLPAILRVYSDWTLCQQVGPGGGLFGLQERVASVVNFSFRGVSTLPLGRLLGRRGVWLTALGFAVGIGEIALTALDRRAPRRAAVGAAAALAWVVVFLVLYAAWLPLDWARFQLPPAAAAALVTAIGWVRLPAWLAAAWRALRGRTAPRGVAAARGILAAVVFSALTFAPWLRRPSDPVARLQAEALVRIGQGRADEALPLLEEALARLGREADGRSVEARRASLLADLSQVHAATGDSAGAAAALEERAPVLRVLRDGSVSGDPYVRAQYDALIDADARQRERLSAGVGLQAPQGSKPGSDSDSLRSGPGSSGNSGPGSSGN